MSNLALLDQATRMLAEIRSVDDAKQLIDLAEAARVYAKQIKLGLEAQNHAAEIKLRAQRRAGEILREMVKNPGAKGSGSNQYTEVRLQATTAPDEAPTYSELGIEKREAHVWQTLASMDTPIFEKFIEDKREAIEEITTAAIYREAKRFIAQNKRPALDLPSKIYRVLYADPPWCYGDKLIDGYGAAEFHYPPMTIQELCALPVKEIAANSAVLFLWVTSPLLMECEAVITAWGFEYKASFVWNKIKHNYGHYNSVRHELLLICTRGSCLPECKELHDSVIEIERSTTHSQKPEYFRELIDKMYPSGSRIELFARGGGAPGWETWGNEAIPVSSNMASSRNLATSAPTSA